MYKIQTIYKLTENVNLIHNEEFKGHICLTEMTEPCGGILKHWGTKKELIAELHEILKELVKTEL